MAKKPAPSKKLEKSKGKPYKPAPVNKNVAMQQQNPYQGGLVAYGQQPKSSWRKSTNDTITAVPRYTKPQQQAVDIVNNYLATGNMPANHPLRNLNLPGNQNSFEPIRQNAYKDFNYKGVPSISERFQAMAGRDFEPGALSSGPLQNQLYRAEEDLRMQLAALEAQNQQQQTNNYLNLYDRGIAPQYDTQVVPGQNSALRKGAQYVANTAADYLAGNMANNTMNQGLNYLTGRNQQNNSPINNQQNNTPINNQLNNNAPLNLTSSLNPYQVQNSTIAGYANQLGPQGGMNRPTQESYFNPQDDIDSKVRGFGNRRY